jgi:ribosomal-protein-alanine N-acetyltransferase
MKSLGTKKIETPRLILRQFQIDDLDSMYLNCYHDEEVWKWTNYQKVESKDDVLIKAKQFTKAWLSYSNLNRYSWAIEIKNINDGKAVGRVFGSQVDLEKETLVLSYELGRRYWNQGYMTEAVNAVLRFLLDEVETKKISAWHVLNNMASGRVMQKCGMEYVGTKKGAAICNAGVFDQINYVILNKHNDSIKEDFVGKD